MGVRHLTFRAVPSQRKLLLRRLRMAPRAKASARASAQSTKEPALTQTAGVPDVAVAAARARSYCFDCAQEVDADDAAHANHSCASLALKPAASAAHVIQSVALELVEPGEGDTRLRTGIHGLDRVLGGGLVTNGMVMIAGEPGIGKSTLFASAAGNLAARGYNVLYASGEETASQVHACARRIGHVTTGVRVISTQSLDDVLREVRSLEVEDWRTDVLIVDSLQAMALSTVSSPIGSSWQVGAVANELRIHAKTTKRAVICVAQVTKDGSAAGPKSAEHAVDTVLMFGRDDRDTRYLRTTKNRFGPVGEVSQFEMGPRGLVEIEDPSLVAWRDLVGEPGVAACVCAHLAKPVLVPVEALVSPDESSGARSIQASGVAVDRVRFVLETLSRHAEANFSKMTVRVRVPQIAGDDVSDPGIDLAIAAACWSSLMRISLGGVVLWGSIGLSGKIQTVGRVESRVEYAERVRASGIVAGHPKLVPPAARIAAVAVAHVADLVGAIDLMRGRHHVHEHQVQEAHRQLHDRLREAGVEERLGAAQAPAADLVPLRADDDLDDGAQAEALGSPFVDDDPRGSDDAR